MSTRERVIDIVDTMGENELAGLLLFIQGYLENEKKWASIEEDEPMDDEMAIFEAYRANGGNLSAEQHDEITMRFA
ncbi:hypothetical protein FACS18949_06060 [Clostridia bacterium]|nr:hypothetical protein FACS18949_06060 [Clostridia bacterium]